MQNSEHLKTVGVLSVASRGTCSASADSMLFRTGDGEFGLWSSVGGRSPQLARPGSARASSQQPKNGHCRAAKGQVGPWDGVKFHAPRPMDGTALLRSSSTAERAAALLPASRLTACFGPGVWMSVHPVLCSLLEHGHFVLMHCISR